MAAEAPRGAAGVLAPSAALPRGIARPPPRPSSRHKTGSAKTAVRSVISCAIQPNELPVFRSAKTGDSIFISKSRNINAIARTTPRRKGSPQTLVCIKTQGSYERRRQQYGTDKKLLAELRGFAGSKDQGQ